MKHWTAIGLIALGLVSCSKKEPSPPDTEASVESVSTPASDGGAEATEAVEDSAEAEQP